MAKKSYTPAENAANMRNKNTGTSGVNKQYQQVKTNTDNQKKGRV